MWIGEFYNSFEFWGKDYKLPRISFQKPYIQRHIKKVLSAHINITDTLLLEGII